MSRFSAASRTTGEPAETDPAGLGPPATRARINRLIGWLGVPFAVALAPPVFQIAFAMAPLTSGQNAFLLVVSLAIAVVCALLIVRRERIRAEAALLFLAVIALFAAELGARATIVVFRPDMKAGLAGLAARTYPEYAAYRGNAFLQFTGQPDLALAVDQALGGLLPFNNYGFFDEDFHIEKPAGTIRIAALGASTTASGYPRLLAAYLNENTTDSLASFETLNFGLGYWTSAHSLVNYVLNVVDFSPDYIVIHHAWNDRVARGVRGERRGDYSHVLKVFERPPIVDRHAIRASVLYRYMKDKIDPRPPWLALDAWTVRPRPAPSGDPLADLSELQPFERNIRTIIDLARLRGTEVVLTTMPHSTDPRALYAETVGQIVQANDVLRRIASGHGEEIIFVDLDEMMTGRMNDVFRDVGHVGPEGRRFKARRIGEAILARRRGELTPAPAPDRMR